MSVQNRNGLENFLEILQHCASTSILDTINKQIVLLSETIQAEGISFVRRESAVRCKVSTSTQLTRTPPEQHRKRLSWISTQVL